MALWRQERGPSRSTREPAALAVPPIGCNLELTDRGGGFER